jgi:uncharacterized protein YraI
MHALHLTVALVFGSVALAAATVPAAAASAVVSENISVYQLPRHRVDEVVGLLRAGEEVTIDRCTASGRWCRVFSGEPTGWVLASYLVGATAKIQATPPRSLTDPQFGPSPLTPTHPSRGGGLF